MPCMGPSVNEAEVDSALFRVLTLLADEYGVWADTPVTIHPILYERMMNARVEATAKLRKAIYDCFMQQACEDF